MEWLDGSRLWRPAAGPPTFCPLSFLRSHGAGQDDPPDNNARDATFNGPSVYPEYLTDTDVCVCPSDSDATSVAQGFHQDGDPDLPIETCRLALIGN